MAEAKKDLKKMAADLVGLSVLEVNELNTILKEEYNIEPVAAAVAPAGGAGGGGSEAGEAEKKSHYNVFLKDAGQQRIAVIKAIKELTELGLSEAKAIVDESPKNVAEKVEPAKAEEMKAKLEEAGAVVELT